MTNQVCSWLVYTDNYGVGDNLIEALLSANNEIITVKAGKHYEYNKAQETYILLPEHQGEHLKIFSSVAFVRKNLENLVYLWPLTKTDLNNLDPLQFANNNANTIVNNLTDLIETLLKLSFTKLPTLSIVTNGLYTVTGSEINYPEKIVIKECLDRLANKYPVLQYKCIDIGDIMWESSKLTNMLIKEMLINSSEQQIAYRNNKRWVIC